MRPVLPSWSQIKDASGSVVSGLRQLYEKHLLAYEQHCTAQLARRPAGARAAALPANSEVGEHMAAQILEAMLKAEPEELAQAEPDSEPPAKRRKVKAEVSTMPSAAMESLRKRLSNCSRYDLRMCDLLLLRLSIGRRSSQNWCLRTVSAGAGRAASREAEQASLHDPIAAYCVAGQRMGELSLISHGSLSCTFRNLFPTPCAMPARHETLLQSRAWRLI